MKETLTKKIAKYNKKKKARKSTYKPRITYNVNSVDSMLAGTQLFGAFGRMGEQVLADYLKFRNKGTETK